MKTINMRKRLSICLVVVIVLGSVGFSSISANAATAKLNKTKLSLNVGKSYTLKLKNVSGKVKWTTSKKSVATVSSKGKVVAKKAGSANITATNNGKKFVCMVTVKNVKAKSIAIKKSVTLTKGSSSTLKCTLKPSNVTVKKVKWSSSNSKIATVSSTGKITAKKSGIATVTATTTDGTKLKSSCTVTVLNKTVNTSVKSNLNALKDYILDKGDTNSYGEAGIFGTYQDSEAEDIYSIRYIPKNKMFVFGWHEDYSDEPDEYNIGVSIEFYYSLTGFDYITAEGTNVYYEYDEVESSYSTIITAQTATYNPDSTIPSIKVLTNTYSMSSEKVKDHTNTEFKYALSCLNSLLVSETGMTLADIGFTNH